MRNLSPEMLEEVFAQFNPSTLLQLLRFVGVDNQGVTHTYRFVNDYQEVVSGGQTYQPLAFRSGLINDTEEGAPSLVITFPVTDDQIVEALRTFDRAPTIYYSVIVAERPNVVEIPEVELEVTSWTNTAAGIRITLQPEPVLNEPIPGDIITPRLHPLLWENVVIKNAS